MISTTTPAVSPVGRTFAIALNPNSYSEHKNEILRQFDKQFCTLTEQLRGPLYVTDLAVIDEKAGSDNYYAPENSDYVQGGFLVIKIDQDGHLC